ncbi:MAG: acyl-CoA dehydrogenase family protein [Polyangiaceae bacterium]
MISFELSEDQRLIQASVADLAKTIGSRVRRFEADGDVDPALRQTVAELGLASAHLPEALGGQGLGLLTATVINEELAVADAATPFALNGLGAFPLALQELATPERAADVLGALDAADVGAVAWSERTVQRERAGFTTTATRSADGYRVTGTKCFVAQAPRATQFVVFAATGHDGWSDFGAFLVPADAPGVKRGVRHGSLGLQAAAFGEVSLDDVQLPASARLGEGPDFVPAVLRFFAKYSLVIAARQVGLARAAFELTREYCDMRKAFGKPIGHFQAVAFTLADRHMDIESARELVRRAAWSWDAGKDERDALLATASAVAHAHEAAMRCSDDAVQLHGGAGFMRDVVVEKLMRDARQLALVGMTAPQMDQLAAAIATGQDLDPARVLPTPETQAVFT